MAKVTIEFDPGDQFTFEQGRGKQGAGVAISPGKAFIIAGQGGRTGYQTSIGLIPEGAMPGTVGDFERKFALDAVSCVLMAR